MRKLDTVRHDEKRQEILAAAGRCFERSGLKGASIADICREGRISPGHLYYYFKSKDAILATLSQAWLDAVSQRFEQLLATEGDIVASVIAEIGKLAPSESKPRFALVFEMLAESTRNAEIAAVLRAHSRKLRDLLANVLREGQQRGSVDSGLDPEIAATALIAMIDGVKALTLRDSGPDRRAVVAMMERVFGAVLERGGDRAPAEPSSDAL